MKLVDKRAPLLARVNQSGISPIFFSPHTKMAAKIPQNLLKLKEFFTPSTNLVYNIRYKTGRSPM
jgi:hypothetical protein